VKDNILSIIKTALKILGWAVPVISSILDLSHKIFFSKVKSILFREFFSLNLLRIIWIIGFFIIFKYLYNRFISWKRILRIAKEFDRLFDNFMNFISDVYDRRENPSKDDKKQYSSYYRKLRSLFSDISSPLRKYLEEKHKDRPQGYPHAIWDNIKGCFSSPNLEEHFKRKPLRPPTDYIQFKHLIEEFIGYLKYEE